MRERLLIYTTAKPATERRDRGIKLSLPKAAALNTVVEPIPWLVAATTVMTPAPPSRSNCDTSTVDRIILVSCGARGVAGALRAAAQASCEIND